MAPPANSDARTLRALRRLVPTLLGCGLAATALELLLIGHVEDTRQLVPFLVTATALVTLIWRTVRFEAKLR